MKHERAPLSTAEDAEITENGILGKRIAPTATRSVSVTVTSQKERDR